MNETLTLILGILLLAWPVVLYVYAMGEDNGFRFVLLYLLAILGISTSIVIGAFLVVSFFITP